MTVKEKPTSSDSLVRLVPFYYGWVMVLLAALAMVATLPGRSIGLGLITEPLINDLGIERTWFATLVFWATLLGSSFSLLTGPAVDRFGVRTSLTVIAAGLGVTVVAMSFLQNSTGLLLLLLLTRGFGQSALSAVSLTVVGKWFERGLNRAMGIFAVLISIGFTIAIVTAGSLLEASGWRTVWGGLGWMVLGIALLSALLLRRSPEMVGLQVDDKQAGDSAFSGSSETANPQSGSTLREALLHPAFWGFAVGSALYNLVISGVTLLNESILGEIGFAEYFEYAMGAFAVSGLAGNALAHRFARRWGAGKMMAVALILVALALLAYPWMTSLWQVVVHGLGLGFAGGVVMVVFFASFGNCFGRKHLGKIQGAAQVLAVFASASGPWILATVKASSGSYAPAFYGLAVVLLIWAVYAWWMRVADKES